MIDSESESCVHEVEAIFSIGSNCGDRLLLIEESINWLTSHIAITSASEIYATPDCNGGKKEYLNAVVKGTTTYPAKALEAFCKEYESASGRTPLCRLQGDVPVDIDLVIYDGQILRPKDASREYFKIGYGMI